MRSTSSSPAALASSNRRANADEIVLNVLCAGDCFGEAELLEGAPRLSTVRASSDVLALRLDAADFRELAGAQPDIRTYHRAAAQAQVASGVLPSRAGLRAPAAGRRLRRRAGGAGADRAERGRDRLPAGRLRRRDVPDRGRPAARHALTRPPSMWPHSRYRRDVRRRVRPARHAAHDHCGGRDTGSLTDVERRDTRLLAAALPSFRDMLDDLGRAARLSTSPYNLADPSTGDRTRQRSSRNAPSIEAPADAPFAVPHRGRDRFVKVHRRSRVPFIQQVDEMDCGAACLAMVARAFGRRVSLARIRQLVNAGLDGASLRLHLPRGRRAGPRDAVGQDLGAASRSHAACQPSCIGTSTTGSSWRPSAASHVEVVDPAVGRRRLTRETFDAPLERLRGALRLHAGARAGSPVDAHAGLDVAARPAARRPPAGGARARRGRQRAADGAADFHAGDRGPGARRPGSVPAPRDDRGDGRDDGLHRPVARAAAISPQLLGGENRCGGARLPHAAPPGAADVVLRLAPDRRSAASSRRHPPGARLPRPARHRRHHGRRPTGRDGGGDGVLQLVADARVPGHVSALCAADDRRGAGAAAGVPRSRGLVRQVPLLSDRCDQGHRDGQGPRGRIGVPPPAARSVPGACRGRSSRPTSRR